MRNGVGKREGEREKEEKSGREGGRKAKGTKVTQTAYRSSAMSQSLKGNPIVNAGAVC